MATQLSFLDDDEQVPNDPEWDRQEQDRNYMAYSDSRSGLLDSVNRYLDKPKNIPPDEEMRAEPVAPPTLEEDIMERVKKRLKREGVEPFKEDPGYEPDPPTDPKNAPPKGFYPMADTALWRKRELQQYPSWLRDIIRTTPIDPINPRGQQADPHDVPIIPIDPAGNMRYEPMLGAGDEQLIAQDWPGTPERPS